MSEPKKRNQRNYITIPVDENNAEHARILAWRDSFEGSSKSDAMRVLATGGGILLDAGVLELIISLERMPKNDAVRALKMALASIDDTVEFANTNAPVQVPHQTEESEPDQKKQKPLPVLGKAR
jgi:hypothetical protein